MKNKFPVILKPIKENVSNFQHYGFEVVDEGIIPNSEVTQWAMLRKNAE